MKYQILTVIFSAVAAFAQNDDSVSPPSLTEVLSSQPGTLSSLSGLLETQPDLVEALAGQSNITILAPSNDAINLFLSDSTVAQQVAADPSIVTAILSYHVVVGAFKAEDFSSTPQFLETLLSNDSYETVEGGQVVEAVATEGLVTFFSALKAGSTVTQADVEFAGGIIHIIDRVLAIPQNIVDTATAANLTSLVQAVTQAGLAETLLEAESITVFAPNNNAFAGLGSLDSASAEDLQTILRYHVVVGTVAYSSSLEDGSVVTLSGESVHISIRNGDVYVNDARVVLADVLISNGVVHVIDSVLNPKSPSAPSPSPTTPGGPDVYEGAACRATAAAAIGGIIALGALVSNF